MRLKEIENLYGNRAHVYIDNVFVNSVKMCYSIELSLSQSKIKFEQAGYKTSRQRQYRWIDMNKYRYMTKEEKREQFIKDINTHIPASVINFAMEQFKNSITYDKWEVE